MRKISKIYIHHSVLPRDQSIVEIRKIHLARGFSDVGYHFIIDGKGEILKARPIERIGAHVRGDNLNSVGICICGNFEEQQPFISQLEGLKKLILSLYEKFGKLQIFGHKDYSKASTLCPGRYLYQLLPEIRSNLTKLCE